MFDTAVKLNPPPKPVINLTTISWVPYFTRNVRISFYKTQLQFKQKDQPWSVGIRFVSVSVWRGVGENICTNDSCWVIFRNKISLLNIHMFAFSHHQGIFLTKECKQDCNAQLPDDLIQNETYEARVRVQPTHYTSTWSDWGPTASWVVINGRPKPTPPPSTAAGKDVKSKLIVLV